MKPLHLNSHHGHSDGWWGAWKSVRRWVEFWKRGTKCRRGWVIEKAEASSVEESRYLLLDCFRRAWWAGRQEEKNEERRKDNKYICLKKNHIIYIILCQNTLVAPHLFPHLFWWKGSLAMEHNAAFFQGCTGGPRMRKILLPIPPPDSKRTDPRLWGQNWACGMGWSCCQLPAPCSMGWKLAAAQATWDGGECGFLTNSPLPCVPHRCLLAHWAGSHQHVSWEPAYEVDLLSRWHLEVSSTRHKQVVLATVAFIAAVSQLHVLEASGSMVGSRPCEGGGVSGLSHSPPPLHAPPMPSNPWSWETAAAKTVKDRTPYVG